MLLKPEMPTKRQVRKAALVLVLAAFALGLGAAMLLFAKFVADHDDPSGRWNAIMILVAIGVVGLLTWMRPWFNALIEGRPKGPPSP